MAKVIHLPALPPGEINAATAADVATDLFWRLVLAYAVREGATSVHYHPWRAGPAGEGTLWCVIGDGRFDLVPPDHDAAWTGQLLSAARRLAVTGPIGRLSAWLVGGAVGRIRLIGNSEASDWCVLTWGGGPLAGAEFFRLSPLPLEAAAASQGVEAS